MTERQAEISLWMVLVSADGKVTDEELDVMIEAGTTRFGDALPLGEVSTVAARAQQRLDTVGAAVFVGEIVPYLPRSAAREILTTAVGIARADGTSSEEEQLIRHVGRELGLDAASIDALLG
jgi:tellurite resistance protein